MQMMSAKEKAALEQKREEMYKAKIDVQDRIRKAASLDDLSENAEYHFAKEENCSIGARTGGVGTETSSCGGGFHR